MIRLSIALIILFNPAWTLADDRLWTAVQDASWGKIKASRKRGER